MKKVGSLWGLYELDRQLRKGLSTRQIFLQVIDDSSREGIYSVHDLNVAVTRQTRLPVSSYGCWLFCSGIPCRVASWLKLAQTRTNCPDFTCLVRRRRQGGWRAHKPQFLAYLVVLFLERMCPTSNTVARLKLKYLAPPNWFRPTSSKLFALWIVKACPNFVGLLLQKQKS